MKLLNYYFIFMAGWNEKELSKINWTNYYSPIYFYSMNIIHRRALLHLTICATFAAAKKIEFLFVVTEINPFTKRGETKV